MPNKWTDEKAEYIKAHYMDKTLDELADDLGVSRPTVINKKRNSDCVCQSQKLNGRKKRQNTSRRTIWIRP